MNKIKALFDKVKWYAVAAIMSVLLYAVGSHLYIDHQNLHTITTWIRVADAELAALKKPQPVRTGPAQLSGPVLSASESK